MGEVLGGGAAEGGVAARRRLGGEAGRGVLRPAGGRQAEVVWRLQRLLLLLLLASSYSPLQEGKKLPLHNRDNLGVHNKQFIQLFE